MTKAIVPTEQKSVFVQIRKGWKTMGMREGEIVKIQINHFFELGGGREWRTTGSISWRCGGMRSSVADIFRKLCIEASVGRS